MADLPLLALESAQPGRSRIVGAAALDEVNINIIVIMNSRSFRWSIGVQDSVGRFLIQGHTLVDRADVFAPYRAAQPGLPPGVLFAMSLAGDGLGPQGFDAWRNTHKMVYRTVA